MNARPDTIAAIATAPGRGGIGVVRISGPLAREIGAAIAGAVPPPRHATFARFRSADGGPLDEGLVLYFPAHRSYTGDDVLELQGHGGPVVLRELLARCVSLGARLAEPGEFTRRAYLNDRLDLAQAESVADLIEASSAEAARCAARSLTGLFSERIRALDEAITDLRLHVEACIDFPEEEIDAGDREALALKLGEIREELGRVHEAAAQGAVLREGLTVVLVGPPNVGKSSLLNRLAGHELAIVTAIPGTTRDPVRATLAIEGVPIHLIDTAGLRDTADEVERVGIERTWDAIAKAGAVLVIEEAGSDSRNAEEDRILLGRMPAGIPVVRVVNKIDRIGGEAGMEAGDAGTAIHLSARTGEGIELLRDWLVRQAGWRPHGEGIYMARERHLVALRTASALLAHAAQEGLQAFELFAEDLRGAHRALGTITGELSADDLLGEIFSRFCIGK